MTMLHCSKTKAQRPIPIYLYGICYAKYACYCEMFDAQTPRTMIIVILLLPVW